MAATIERNTLDLRYQDYRLRDAEDEARLLASIARRGIDEPLEGVDTSRGPVLLDGFKRYRCAGKLCLEVVPYKSLGREETEGILQLMRARRQQGLNILEQARFVVELLDVHGLNLAEVAETLGRSKSWVSMRHTLWTELSPTIATVLFAGRFPVYAYMYSLRPFRRMNEIRQQEIERFILALAGKHLSVRDIELLAQVYFRGPDSFRQAIEQGQLDWSLQQLKSVPQNEQACSDLERALLRELQTLTNLLQRVATKCQNPQLASRAFFAEANLLSGSLLAKLGPFQERMKEFHDRSGNA